MNASDHFDSYRSDPDFPARPADLSRIKDDDELEDLSNRPEVMSLSVAGSDDDTGIERCKVIENAVDGYWLTTNTLKGKYLWLVRTDDVKIALEAGTLRRTRTLGPLKHTNLTAGIAHAGGELWFESDAAIYINGGSSRFKSRSGFEFEAVVAAFQAAGYAICSFGWDYGSNTERRFLRQEDIKWI